MDPPLISSLILPSYPPLDLPLLSSLILLSYSPLDPPPILPYPPLLPSLIRYTKARRIELATNGEHAPLTQAWEAHQASEHGRALAAVNGNLTGGFPWACGGEQAIRDYLCECKAPRTPPLQTGPT